MSRASNNPSMWTEWWPQREIPPQYRARQDVQTEEDRGQKIADNHRYFKDEPEDEVGIEEYKEEIEDHLETISQLETTVNRLSEAIYWLAKANRRE